MSLVWANVSGYKYCFCSNKICILQSLGIADNSLILSSYSSLPWTSRTSHLPVHVCVWHQRTLQNGIIRWERCMWMSASLCPSNEEDSLCVLVPGASVYLSSFSLISTVTVGPFNSMPSPFCPEQLKWSPPLVLFILHTIAKLSLFRFRLTRKSDLECKMPLPQPPCSWKHKQYQYCVACGSLYF